MPQFTVENSSGDHGEDFWGQSFLPSDVGPNGSGTPENVAHLQSVSFGFPTYVIDTRAEEIVIYDKPVQGDDPPTQVFHSTGKEDTIGTFGENTFARRYIFEPAPILDIDTTYYVYFVYPLEPGTGDPICQRASCIWGNVYQSGAAILPDGTLESEVTLQFRAVFEVEQF